MLPLVIQPSGLHPMTFPFGPRRDRKSHHHHCVRHDALESDTRLNTEPSPYDVGSILRSPDRAASHPSIPSTATNAYLDSRGRKPSLTLTLTLRHHRLGRKNKESWRGERRRMQSDEIV